MKADVCASISSGLPAIDLGTFPDEGHAHKIRFSVFSVFWDALALLACYDLISVLGRYGSLRTTALLTAVAEMPSRPAMAVKLSPSSLAAQ
jgi:hypothetical protein